MTRVGELAADLQVRPITKGQIATFEVEGGFARGPAPCDGLLVETRSTTFLLPREVVLRALRQLGRDLDRER